MKEHSMNQTPTIRTSRPSMVFPWFVIVATVLGTIVVPARSQDGTEDPPPTKEVDPPQEEAPPSLDDLLDIPLVYDRHQRSVSGAPETSTEETEESTHSSS